MKNISKQVVDDFIVDAEQSGELSEIDICDIGFAILKYGLAQYDFNKRFKKIGIDNYINELNKLMR